MKRKGTFLLNLFNSMMLACMIGVFYAPSESLAEYSILHNFGGGADDGLTPSKSLTLSGTVLYGMTKFGGSAGHGVIFKVNTDGGAFAILHAFTGSDTDGSGPLGSLTLSGSTLYGVTANGGTTIRAERFLA